MLSQTAEYALRATLHLALARDGGPVGVAELAAALGIPRNYLSQTLHQLAREGVLDSVRGKRGGFSLARSPRQTTVLEVIGPFDRVDVERKCLLGRPSCSDSNPCLAHGRWRELSGQLAAFFRETTIADLIDQGRVNLK